jgi:hypothetical protein
VAQQITSRPGLFIAGYTALALALGALVIALRGCSRPQPISDNSGSCHDGSIPDL